MADAQEREFLSYGLQAVYFDNRDGTYSNLDQLLELAVEMSSAEGKSGFIPQAFSLPVGGQSALGPSVTDVKHEPEQPRLGVSLAWLEEISAITEKDLKENED